MHGLMPRKLARAAHLATAPRKPPRVRRRLADRREQLLDLGRALFNERSYDEISIDDIAAAAGISKGLLYHYFPSKRVFYVEGVRAAAAHMLDIVEPVDRDLPPIDRLRVGLDRYLDYVEANARAYATLFRSGMGVDAAVSTIIEETRERILARIVEGLGDPLRVIPPVVALVLRGWIGMVESASLDWLERRREVPRDILRDLLVTSAQTLVVAALERGST